MKRGTFKDKPRKQMTRSAFKRPTVKPKRIKKKKRDKLPSVKTMRNKCDKLLSPLIKRMYPTSMFGEETQVAHHFIKKSQSSALRYYIPNLIPLTNAQHQALHNNESFWSTKIVQIRGMEWFDDLEAKKNEYVKTDVHFYIENYKRLTEIHDNL